MLELLRAWLNGARDYNTGVTLYSQASANADLLEVLRKGPNDFRTRRLQEELLKACTNLKIAANANKLVQDANKIAPDANTPPANADLYDACKTAADQQFKKVMNLRAVLFKMAAPVQYEDVNTEAKISDRAKLALDVVTGYQLGSLLYDKADYVKTHGRLPSDGDDEEESEYDHLHDHLVKLRLDNARKAYNKLKGKEPTPERIALMQSHEENIIKLEAKWKTLKP